MRKSAATVTVRAVETFVQNARPQSRLHCGERGLGLYLTITRAGSAVWILRFKKPSTQRATEASLGKYSLLSLADARRRAREMLRELTMNGRDPVEAKREKRRQANETSSTFANAVEAYAGAPAFRGRNTTATLVTMLDRHARMLMPMPLSAIDTPAVARALHACHINTPKFARRVLASTARVLDFAKVAGMRSGDNPATFKGNLEFLWGPKVPTTHYRALAYDQVPALYRRLVELDDMSAAWCLRFLILTCVRSSNALYATHAEIDMSTRQWVIPPERMKMKGRDPFVVPLGDEATAIVEAMRERRPQAELIFTSDRHHGPLPARVLQYTLQSVLGIPASAHGMRSSFSTWAHDCTTFDHLTIEAALAHESARGNSVARAYNRGNQLMKRAQLMRAWQDHVLGVSAGGVVVPLKIA
jgi:integrase